MTSIFAPDDVREARRAICADCPHQEQVLKIAAFCKACGCPIKPKTSFAASFCPLGRWQSTPQGT